MSETVIFEDALWASGRLRGSPLLWEQTRRLFVLLACGGVDLISTPSGRVGLPAVTQQISTGFFQGFFWDSLTLFSEVRGLLRSDVQHTKSPSLIEGWKNQLLLNAPSASVLRLYKSWLPQSLGSFTLLLHFKIRYWAECSSEYGHTAGSAISFRALLWHLCS